MRSNDVNISIRIQEAANLRLSNMTRSDYHASAAFEF
jgi:hypothetical protein